MSPTYMRSAKAVAVDVGDRDAAGDRVGHRLACSSEHEVRASAIAGVPKPVTGVGVHHEHAVAFAVRRVGIGRVILVNVVAAAEDQHIFLRVIVRRRCDVDLCDYRW